MLCATFGRTIRRGRTGAAIRALSLFGPVAKQAGAVGVAEARLAGCALLLIERAEVWRATRFGTGAGFAVATLLACAARRATFVGTIVGATFVVGFATLAKLTRTWHRTFKEPALNRQ